MAGKPERRRARLPDSLTRDQEARMGKRGRRADRTGRSEGEGRFLSLPYWVMETPAWLALSPNCKVALLAVAKRFNGHNNGRIAFGVRSGIYVTEGGKLVEKPFGMSRFQVGRALAEAERAGFIACTQDGSFDQKRLVREWRLTWLSCNGQLATKDFVRAQPRPNPKHRSTAAPSLPLAGSPAHMGPPPTDPARSNNAPMVQSDRSTSAHHLVNQGGRGRRDELQAA